ncbi:MAG TPA: hypothetical protein VHL98_21485 [Microvirga sp.]|nr:hypothetical protein [Microvirga sp.]
MRRRHTAIHEAGHCLARWYFGHLTERVQVFSIAEVAAGAAIDLAHGVSIPCEGRTEGADLAPHPSERDRLLGASDSAREAVARVEMALIEGYAGLVAEAHHRRRALEVCIEEGGEADMAQNGALLREWFGKDAQDAAAAQAWRRAGALVRSPSGWRAVTALADALMERGTLSGTEIARLCRRAYGLEPDYEAWIEHWPPRLDELRAGYAPSAPPLAAAA